MSLDGGTMMDTKRAVEILKANVPKTAKMVDGRYKGGFDDWESDMGQAIRIAITTIENQERLLKAYEDTGLTSEEITALKKDYEKRTCTGCWLKDGKNTAKRIDELKGLLESAVEELENVYQRETEFTERIREVI